LPSWSRIGRVIEIVLQVGKESSLRSKVFIPVVILALVCVPLLALDSEDPATQEILDRYLAHAQNQQTALRGMNMDMDIDAKLPKLKKTGTFHAFRSVSKLGMITYNGLKFIGDNTIKKDVINRYLQAENETKDVAQLAITPANYKFKYKGMVADEGHLVHVFQLSPRKKSVGLFKGELWLDAQTCLPVRESGRFVKSPSIFLKKIEFVREYDILDGISIPRHIESTVDTRLWGPAEMSIKFSNVARTNEDPAAVPVATRDVQ
jgi:hypothetical protein